MIELTKYSVDVLRFKIPKTDIKKVIDLNNGLSQVILKNGTIQTVLESPTRINQQLGEME